MSLILRIFFRLLYHEMAWAYDFIAAFVSGRRWKTWVSAALPLVQGSDVLELGFGPGHLLSALSQNGINVVGLDASRQMVRQAQRRLSHQKCSPPIVRGLGQSLPFHNGSFDTVVATFPSGFIFQSATLQDIRRILRPGGSLVVLLSAWITSRSILSRFFVWLFRITGQSPSEQVDELKLLETYSTAGLDAHLRWIDSPGSRLLFVIATRM